MKRITALALVGDLWLGSQFRCNAPENVNRTRTPPTPTATSLVTSGSTAEIDRVLGVSAGFKPIYKVLEVKDASTATASRKVVHVSLPKGTYRQPSNPISGTLRKKSMRKVSPTPWKSTAISKATPFTRPMSSGA